MKRAPYGSTVQFKKDSHQRDNIINEHGGYEGLQNTEKYVQGMLGERCNLDSLHKFVNSHDLKPTRIFKRKKDLLILWIYDQRKQFKEIESFEAFQFFYPDSP